MTFQVVTAAMVRFKAEGAVEFDQENTGDTANIQDGSAAFYSPAEIEPYSKASASRWLSLGANPHQFMRRTTESDFFARVDDDPNSSRRPSAYAVTTGKVHPIPEKIAHVLDYFTDRSDESLLFELSSEDCKPGTTDRRAGVDHYLGFVVIAVPVSELDLSDQSNLKEKLARLDQYIRNDGLSHYAIYDKQCSVVKEQPTVTKADQHTFFISPVTLLSLPIFKLQMRKGFAGLDKFNKEDLLDLLDLYTESLTREHCQDTELANVTPMPNPSESTQCTFR